MRVARLSSAAAVLLAAAAGVGSAQTGQIALYADAGYTDCRLVDGSPATALVYVVHHTGTGATACQFMVRAGSGVTLTYVGETIPHSLAIGDTQSGVSVAYGQCLSGDVLVATIRYFTTGTSAACSWLQVVADPNSLQGYIEAVDCNQYRLQVSGTRLVINPDGTCECGPTTEYTSWGKIKGRYGE